MHGRRVFVIRFFKVSFSIKLAVFLASGCAYMKLKMFGTVGRASGDARMKHIVGTANRRISNPPEAEMMKSGIAAL